MIRLRYSVRKHVELHRSFYVSIATLVGISVAILILVAFVQLGITHFRFEPRGYYTNVYTELFGVFFSVFVSVIFIGGWTEWRSRRRLKDQLLREVGSRSNDIALSAADQLHHRRWVIGEKSLLKGESLVEANLKWAQLPGANLENVNFQSAILDDATLIRANLQGAILRGAYLRRARLARAKLQGAFMDFTILHGAFLERAELQGNNLLLSKLQNAELPGACLEGAKLWATNLEGANMRAANLKNADLRGAYLTGATLPNKEKLEGTVFPDGTTITADIDYEELERFTDPEHGRYGEASKAAKAFREEKGLFWDEVTQPYRVIYKPDIW